MTCKELLEYEHPELCEFMFKDGYLLMITEGCVKNNNYADPIADCSGRGHLSSEDICRRCWEQKAKKQRVYEVMKKLADARDRLEKMEKVMEWEELRNGL